MKTQTCKTSHMRINSLRKITNCLLFLILISISFIAKAQIKQMSLTSSGADNRVPPTNNISKENLIGFGADLFFPKDALAVTPVSNYITAIMNNENSKEDSIRTNFTLSPIFFKKEDCPNKEKLETLCDSIALSIREKDKKDLYYYEYERKILEASCVDQLNDSEAEISRKVNIMWNKYENELLACTSANFEVTNGSILKLAVCRRLDSLIQDAVLVWKVNLNRVDAYDEGTVLDYVLKIWKIQKDPDNAKSLERYYNLLRSGGAKHASELKK